MGAAALLGCAAIVIAALMLRDRAEPILKARVIQTLSTRFESRVVLKSFHVSVTQGFVASGEGLELYPYRVQSDEPTIMVKSFTFRTRWRNMLRTPMYVGQVGVEGLRLNLPPRAEGGNPSGGLPKLGRVQIDVGEIHCTDAVLRLRPRTPGKEPLHFEIADLVLRTRGKGQPMDFAATLTNPKPVGHIESTGSYGPWNAEDPSKTAVQGVYSFQHADLSTLRGIGGILSSSGQYGGTLDRIVVDGVTDTPNFMVTVSGHPVPLRTQFHAVVNGTDGNTYLQPVRAQFLHSALTASGFVVRAKDAPGHTINLDVVMDRAQIQDLLWLGVRTPKPVMTGQSRLRTRLILEPGHQDVPHRLELHGWFSVVDAHFTNPKVQSKADELSLRSQGKTWLAKQQSVDPTTVRVPSAMQGYFHLRKGVLTIRKLEYDLPGTQVHLDGVYTLDGNTFDFYGKADLQARLSHVVGGWKGALLTPINPFFAKNGAGTEIPIKISGTQSEPHFGLNMRHNDKLEQKRRPSRE